MSLSPVLYFMVGLAFLALWVARSDRDADSVRGATPHSVVLFAAGVLNILAALESAGET